MGIIWYLNEMFSGHMLGSLTNLTYMFVHLVSVQMTCLFVRGEY